MEANRSLRRCSSLFSNKSHSMSQAVTCDTWHPRQQRVALRLAQQHGGYHLEQLHNRWRGEAGQMLGGFGVVTVLLDQLSDRPSGS